MLDVGGQDATEAFEDVGHSDEAREILAGMLVGNVKRSVCLPFFPSTVGREATLRELKEPGQSASQKEDCLARFKQSSCGRSIGTSRNTFADQISHEQESDPKPNAKIQPVTWRDNPIDPNPTQGGTFVAFYMLAVLAGVIAFAVYYFQFK